MSNRVRTPLPAPALLAAAASSWALLACCESMEHPQHPRGAGQEPSLEEVAVFLEGHVAAQAREAPDGRFAFSDESRRLSLALDHVHRERLSKIADGVYFVCADFKGADGVLYDLDFWVEAEEGEMEVKETTLHKIAGKPLYNWVEEGGVWVRKTLDGKPMDARPERPEHRAGGEHPEHPR